MSRDISKIRNFCIVAHIDHGKSTLADRMLQMTNTVSDREFRNQLLDDMDLERERGITIKAKAVTLEYKGYTLNLIDTPGHVDFSYEVSRSLAACEGALLLVDASQGVEAQTVANYMKALEGDLEIIPVLNKVDIQSARPDEIAEEMEKSLGIDAVEALHCSAKSGLGVEGVLDAVIEGFPPPEGDENASFQALVFDSIYDTYQGVIVYVRVMNGRVVPGKKIRFLGTNATCEVNEIGIFRPAATPVKELAAGDVGYIIGSIKTIEDVRVGDTVTRVDEKDVPDPLPGYREPLPMVYCGLYPVDSNDYEALRKALDKLRLNDSSFTFEPESSEALGFGFRTGFLGLLHMEIVHQRLERESNLALVQSAPNVTYEILQKDGNIIEVHSPADVPDPNYIDEFREPWILASILVPEESLGEVMKLNEEKRARFKRQEWIGSQRVLLEAELPLSEVIYDYHDRLKSVTRGYGTLDYEVIGNEPADLVKLQILINGREVDALSMISHRDQCERRGRELLETLKKEIPQHMFQIPLQAAIGAKIIARQNIRAMRKNVTAKCYGGDISRKRKLLEKQKAGKKRMKQIGQVSIPQGAFMAALKIGRG